MRVKWDEKTCIHAGHCVTDLPSVFKIEDNKFVINESGANEDEIKKQVDKCPSGALTTED